MSKLHCTGVYQIRNTINGKRYIGSTTRSFRNRWALHGRQLRNGRHHSRALQRAWNKYGKDAFVFEAVLYCAPEHCLMYEQIYMDHFRCADGRRGYNSSPTAGNCLGVKHGPETRAKLSAANKGRKCPWVREARLGTKHAEETKAKISASNMGRRFSAESIAKMCATRKGKKYSKRGPETRAKQSAALKGRKLSPEHIAKMRARRHDQATKEKMRAGWARRLAMLAAAKQSPNQAVLFQ